VTPALILMLLAAGNSPLLEVYLDALNLWASGELEGASALFGEIAERMPHAPRAVYNLAALAGRNGLWGRADTLMTALQGWEDMGGDSLFDARVSASLGRAIVEDDCRGVREQLETMLPVVVAGTADSITRHNYEVALRWLSQQEPPPRDESRDRQDEENREDEQQDEDEEGREDEQRDGEDREDEQQQGEDGEDREDDRKDRGEETPQSAPPEAGEMTPEEAQRILDMVEEAEPMGDKNAYGAVVPGAPDW